MPRSGPLGTFTLPGQQANATPLEPISSATNNQGWTDVAQTFNTVQPEAYGGTGASTFAQARTNLGVVTGAVGAVNSRRNRIVNHDMRVSQENGTTAGTTNGRYPVDQWAQYFVTSAGVLTVQQVASVTPAGSPNRLRATVTTADASLAAGEYWTLSQNLEGSNVADFRYGSASAFASVLRFGFKGPAGTYAVHLGNSAANRSFVALFTIAAGQANTDTVQTIALPGDTTGTWLTADGVIGITLDIVLAAGTTFQGVAGWQAGNVLGTSAVSNGMASAGAVFELFDVGLRLDPDATGVYGQYEVGEEHWKFNPRRYLRRIPYATVGETASATVWTAFIPLEPPMAKIPVGAFQGGLTIDNGASAYTAAAPSIGAAAGNETGVRWSITGFSGLPAPFTFSAAGNPLLILARLSP